MQESSLIQDTMILFEGYSLQFFGFSLYLTQLNEFE